MNFISISRREFAKAFLGLVGWSLFPRAGFLLEAQAQTPQITAPQERFFFAQLIYRGGDPIPYKRSHDVIMKDVILRTSVEASTKRIDLKITDPALFFYPFLYMAGKEEFEPFTDAEIETLRRYLTFGGFLLVDDAAGYWGNPFDNSARREIKRIFPEKETRRLPSAHSVLRSFYLIKRIGGRKIVSPFLEGIDIEDRTPIIYCRNDLGGAWEKDYLGNWAYECEPGREAQRQDALKLGVNIVLYALTLNYKQDQIHKPFLRKKIG